MKQNIPYKQSDLLSRSTQAIYGANKNVAAVPLVYNNAAAIGLRRSAAIDASDARDVGVQDLRNLRLDLEAKELEGRTFAMLVRDVLSPGFGRRYSQAWAGTGFTNKLKVPVSLEGLETLLESLSRFLTDNPGKESSSSGVTAAAASTLHSELSALRLAVEGKESDLRTLTQVKQAKFVALRACLFAQARELKELISPVDFRWLDYGLNVPGLKERPATPANIIVTLMANSVLSVKWDDSARAEYYRVWMRIVSIDTEPGIVGSPADPNFLIESAPANSTVELALSALNNGGESVRSEVITVQVP